jgi:hypothetical protein
MATAAAHIHARIFMPKLLLIEKTYARFFALHLAAETHGL